MCCLGVNRSRRGVGFGQVDEEWSWRVGCSSKEPMEVGAQD